MQMGHYKLFRWEVWHDEEAWLDFPAWMFPHSNYGFIKSIISPKANKKLWGNFIMEKNFILLVIEAIERLLQPHGKHNSDFCFYSILEYFHRIYVKKIWTNSKVLSIKWGGTEKTYLHNVEWEGWKWGFEKNKILGLVKQSFPSGTDFWHFVLIPKYAYCTL